MTWGNPDDDRTARFSPGLARVFIDLRSVGFTDGRSLPAGRQGGL